MLVFVNTSCASVNLAIDIMLDKEFLLIHNPDVESSVKSSSIHDLQKCRSNLESLFCYDKSYPEENIEMPVGLTMDKKEIGNHPPCTDCEVKGAVLCATCEGSSLYVDSILESQGIIVKARCLGNVNFLHNYCISCMTCLYEFTLFSLYVFYSWHFSVV
ncbi:hypothetical protein ZIOFF_057494 [Zingiber officinale]|uniref:Uncharacterized protein n=1 Tax=Zingiber officinale TaxID=94328 RepID=A0A8J5F9N8_ZINOF|nr:hypothetical protein ZIOFF_057494 [Zingiber officinale]